VRDEALRIYLNDHLAGSVLGAQTARHLLDHNEKGALGEFLRDFLIALSEERAILTEVMALVGAPVNPFKVGGAWLAEKLQHLKINARFVRYTEASRFAELEALCLGVRGKALMWRMLAELGVVDPRLIDFDFVALHGRARAQERVLRQFRLLAGHDAFRGELVAVI
jgi:hypothetical protein